MYRSFEVRGEGSRGGTDIGTGLDALGPQLRQRGLTVGHLECAAEALARRERGTLGSIWGYESEWRDTTLGYVKAGVSSQVAMVVDPLRRQPPVDHVAGGRADGSCASGTGTAPRRAGDPQPGGQE